LDSSNHFLSDRFGNRLYTIRELKGFLRVYILLVYYHVALVNTNYHPSFFISLHYAVVGRFRITFCLSGDLTTFYTPLEASLQEVDYLSIYISAVYIEIVKIIILSFFTTLYMYQFFVNVMVSWCKSITSLYSNDYLVASATYYRQLKSPFKGLSRMYNLLVYYQVMPTQQHYIVCNITNIKQC